MVTREQLAALREELRNEIRAEIRSEVASAAASTPDAIKRKPEIPAFDKGHINEWIRRTENAFIRALINTPREKFAFLETKFPVDFNPRINEFLWGDATEEKWKEFLTYLRTEYGPTKQQRASIFVDGFKRDGRRPSQYAALLDDKTKDVSVDDIKKEMLIREMPTDVQRMLQERIDGLTFKEAAKVADAYFDRDGKPRHTSMAPSIHAVEQDEQLSHDDSNVNAVNRIGQQQPRKPASRNYTANANYTINRNHAQRGGRNRMTRGWHAQTANNLNTPQPQNANSYQSGRLCFNHWKYKDNATKCEVGCPRFDEMRFPGNGRAGQK